MERNPVCGHHDSASSSIVARGRASARMSGVWSSLIRFPRIYMLTVIMKVSCLTVPFASVWAIRLINKGNRRNLPSALLPKGTLKCKREIGISGTKKASRLWKGHDIGNLRSWDGHKRSECKRRSSLQDDWLTSLVPWTLALWRRSLCADRRCGGSGAAFLQLPDSHTTHWYKKIDMRQQRRTCVLWSRLNNEFSGWQRER